MTIDVLLIMQLQHNFVHPVDVESKAVLMLLSMYAPVLLSMYVSLLYIRRAAKCLYLQIK